MQSVLVEDLEDVVFKIHVFGYKTMGESVLFILWDKKRKVALYVVVIDIFERKDKTGQVINRTFERLKEYGCGDDRKIDLMCWSHPDFDHSRGLDLLLERFCDENTKILVPFGLHDPLFSQIKHNLHDQEYIEKLLSINDVNGLSCVPISVVTKEKNDIETLLISSTSMGVGDSPVEVHIHALSPYGSVLSHKIRKLKQIPKNELAIVLGITMGNYRFVFGSDILNTDILNLNRDYLSEPLFIKVPHHGSESSEDFLKVCRMDPGCTIACMTAFEKKKLPDMKIKQQYVKKCRQVDFTSKNNFYYWGEVEYQFNLFNDSKYFTSYHGNAK